MSFRIISAEELAEWEQCPAKQYIGLPLEGYSLAHMPPERVQVINEYRAAYARWVETTEANEQAQKIKALQALIDAEQNKLERMFEDATKTERDAWISTIRTKTKEE